MVDINDAKMYKPCQKKQYDIHVCMPEKGAIVVNKLEQAEMLQSLSNVPFVSAQAVQQGFCKDYQQAVLVGRAYLVSDKTPFVLCGTVGALRTVAPGELQSAYSFLRNGQPEQINNETLRARLVDGVLPWIVVRTNPAFVSGKAMACFVPVSQRCQVQTAWGAVLDVNGPGVSHGKGDFIVCEVLPNGRPNLQNRLVVNGNVFATTYNNRGWTQCLDLSAVSHQIKTDNLPEIIQKDNSLSIYQFACRKLTNIPGVVCLPFARGCDTRFEPDAKAAVAQLECPVVFSCEIGQRRMAIDQRGRGFFFKAMDVMAPHGDLVKKKDIKTFSREDIIKFADFCKYFNRC